jgi:hypothetical protein
MMRTKDMWYIIGTVAVVVAVIGVISWLYG